MLFTFKRDDDGRETIYLRVNLPNVSLTSHQPTGDIAIARPTNGPEGFEWLNSMPGITAEHIREAAVKADEAGFWNYNSGYIVDARKSINEGAYTPEEWFGVGGWGNVINEVTVEVPVAETTSTTLTIDNTEDQA